MKAGGMNQALDVHWTVTGSYSGCFRGLTLGEMNPCHLPAALGPSSGGIRDNEMRGNNSANTHRGANFAL